MFTLGQIDDIHDRFGRQDTLGQYLRALSAIGVERSDSFIADGHSEYFGTGGETVVTPPAHRGDQVATLPAWLGRCAKSAGCAACLLGASAWLRE